MEVQPSTSKMPLKSQKHFGSLSHKVNTEKLRVMLREVFKINIIILIEKVNIQF